jgi:hypothetical protein
VLVTEELTSDVQGQRIGPDSQRLQQMCDPEQEAGVRAQRAIRFGHARVELENCRKAGAVPRGREEVDTLPKSHRQHESVYQALTKGLGEIKRLALLELMRS